MHYRVVKINVNQGQMDEIVNCLDSISNRLYDLEGLQSIHCVKASDTEIYAFSCYETQEQVQKATAFQQEVFGGMAKFFSAPPKIIEGPQMWHWSPTKATI